jgi:hypothetical protein
MTTTLDHLESEVWHFAAEPTPERMDLLLQEIVSIQGATVIARTDILTRQPEPEPEPKPVLPAPVPAPALELPQAGPAPEPDASADVIKTCSGCKQGKIASLDRERTSFNRDSSTKDGFKYRCRPCESAYRANARKQQQRQHATAA